jgi:hypothetical protein
MAEPNVPESSRRTLLVCTAATCVAALAGCARYNSNNGGVAGGQPAQSSAPTAGPSGPPVLASTADIPVGGGKILADKKIVITQPQAGTFASRWNQYARPLRTTCWHGRYSPLGAT